MARRLRAILQRVAGRPARPQPDTLSELFAPGAMVGHLRGTLASDRYQPPLLPTIAAQLLTLTRDPEASLSAARELLERDPIIAAKVLQLAQSALYGGAYISSLHQAVTRLGFNTLSNVLLETVASSRIFSAEGYAEPMRRLQRHSTATAHVTRVLCEKVGISDESAFTCGLLHDAGTAIGILIFADPTVTRWGARRLPPFERLAEPLQTVHEEASATLALAWSLSPRVAEVVAGHHLEEPSSAQDPLCCAVCLADWLAHEAGAPFEEQVDEQAVERAVEGLRLSDQALAELAAEARRVIDHL